MCNVLDEMRALDKTRNYGPLAGLIEEVQIMGNRMEAGLFDGNDLKYDKKRHKKLKEEIKKLKEEKEKLGGKKEKSRLFEQEK